VNSNQQTDASAALAASASDKQPVAANDSSN